MYDHEPVKLKLLPKLVFALLIILIVVGAVWHGVTVDAIDRLWHDLVERPDSTMRFRFILQPLMAAIAAVRAGIRDARAGHAPYLVRVLRNRRERIGLLNESVNATARIILLGVVMDVIYQALVLKTFYPNEAVAVALLLAFVPYLILRGLVLRVWRARASARPAP
jgi:Tfp pilus assembly protein PilO